MIGLTQTEIIASASMSLKTQFGNRLDFQKTVMMMKTKKLFGSHLQACSEENNKRNQRPIPKKISKELWDLLKNRKAFYRRPSSKENIYTKNLTQTKMDMFHWNKSLMELKKA